ncbi:metallophosphoesterase family protein [Legionella shakespearei]|uniref:3',5'-cyclic-nucleotide phosphodiesterase n=1 Tax=Legionella shakespearei DSM 23087 TaxID=1122169 RepID=A0A0W0YZF7_9GAMM|nr:metallophosphoesterase [Legionella shakespearei]KTD62292.1 3',5'-cyclic-nucleotide phosphodiesterase [Legionella shakespearei DSM 23087]
MNIVHISDLHFGMNDPAIIAAFLQDLESLKPELMIISGDLTQRARTHEFEQLSTFLQGFTVPLLIVPGNHDIPLYNPVSRFIEPFKQYKNYVSPKLDATYADERVNILGINSATPYKIKDGTLRKKDLKRINSHFSATKGQLNILFFHHNLKYFSGMHQPLDNAKEFLYYLKDSPIHIVCTGHLHYGNLTLITKNNGKQCALLHAGSTFCPRTKDGKNSFYVITGDHLRCSVDWRVFDKGIFSSYKVYDIDLNTVKRCE